MKTLKEKREELSSVHKGHYWEEDVIEFIKELKKELKKNCLVYPQVIDKLTGNLK